MRAAVVLIAAIMLVPVVPSRAEALTIRDLIELSRAGLSDEVLVALIEVDRSVFSIDTATLRSLKDAGVSERVILAVVRSGRPRVEPGEASQPQPDVTQAAPEPQVVVIEHREPPRVEYVPVAVPVYYAGFSAVPRVPRPPQEPVYWGWGGKLRPDAWQPTPPTPPQKGELVKIDPPIKLEPPVIRR